MGRYEVRKDVEEWGRGGMVVIATEYVQVLVPYRNVLLGYDKS